MRIYIICPVRNVTDQQQAMIDAHAAALEADGHVVHNPRRSVDQNDADGVRIVREHADFLRTADAVHIFWDAASSGSHVDLGSAIILNTPLRLVHEFTQDGPGKSYAKVIKALAAANPAIV